MTQPEINSERLTLRSFQLTDADIVQKLAGVKAVADVTANIPHPYADGLAEKWIASHEANFRNRTTVTYAVTLKNSGQLMGCVSLIGLDSETPEIGYWMGVDYWGAGYCTEACQLLISFCKTHFRLKTVFGKHLTRNPASGRVMEKCGFEFVSKGQGQDGFMKQVEEFKIYKRELG